MYSLQHVLIPSATVKSVGNLSSSSTDKLYGRTICFICEQLLISLLKHDILTLSTEHIAEAPAGAASTCAYYIGLAPHFMSTLYGLAQSVRQGMYLCSFDRLRYCVTITGLLIDGFLFLRQRHISLV